MTFFPPCTATRVWISQDEYDRLRMTEQELNALKRGRPQALGECLRERYESPIPQPVYIQPGTIIDCSTGQPWQPGPRKRPAQLAPYGVRPSDLPKPTQPTQPDRPRGWQEPIERLQPIRINRQPEPVPWSLGGMVEPAPDPEPESVPAWLRELAEPEPAPETEPAAVYRPMTGGVTRPPDKAPGEKKPKRKNMKRPKRAKANPWVAAIAAAFDRVEGKGVQV